MGMTVVFTWVFNNTRGSILLAILLHASINTAPAMLPLLFPSLEGTLLFALSRLLAWVVVARIYGFSGPRASLCAVAACGVPMLVWSIRYSVRSFRESAEWGPALAELDAAGVEAAASR